MPPAQINFAHKLIDEVGVDIVHGHSSHHMKGIEVYRDRPIIYGAGDFLNDYEGISGQEQFRADLVLMYFVTMNPATGHLIQFKMTPMQIKHFRLYRASRADTLWLRDLLTREGQQFAPLPPVVGMGGARVEMKQNNRLGMRIK